MIFHRTRLFVGLASLPLLFLGAGPAQAASYQHIDELAVQLSAQTRALLREVDAHYRHKPGYGHLRSDVVQLRRLAHHMHTIAHRRGATRHLLDDLQSADRLFHHLEGLVKRMNWSRAGHIDGNPRHVGRLLGQIERTLHHLQDDVAHLVGGGHPGRVLPGGRGRDFPGRGGYGGRRRLPGTPAVGYRWRGGGVFYNNGRLVVRVH